MRELNKNELTKVHGGTDTGCGCGPKKGNNGWGNGAEGTNNGSNSGGTAGSKSDELWTDGDGPRPSKFTTR